MATKIVVIISADTEWRAIRGFFPGTEADASPFGEWFVHDVRIGKKAEGVIFFHGGWGKIAAAASTQYVIDRWAPDLLMNLGTCGGFEGEIERGTIILVEKTVVYDMVDLMGDHAEHIAHYVTDLDLSWLGERYPQGVQRDLLVSADRDIAAREIPELKRRYGARAADWESGAIAWTAKKNNTRCLILRGVTDLVGPGGGEAYGNFRLYAEAAEGIMKRLVQSLPAWIELAFLKRDKK